MPQPLLIAVESNRVDVVAMLLERGADIEKPSNDNETPLCVAYRLGYTSIVTVLLERGAKLSAFRKAFRNRQAGKPAGQALGLLVVLVMLGMILFSLFRPKKSASLLPQFYTVEDK